MPRFSSSHRKLCVSTSYKVMYTSLTRSASLREISEERLSTILDGADDVRHFMIVRDPYVRLASFFADKLRRDLDREKTEWQKCQRMLFHVAGVTGAEPFEVIREAFRKITFADFVDLLPCLYFNGHLRPQHLLYTASGRDLRARTETLPIETSREQLCDLIGVASMPYRDHSAMHPDINALGRSQRETVNRLYAEDFAAFGYAMR